MRQIMMIKYLCEDALEHLNKCFKFYNSKSTSFEYTIRCIYTDRSNKYYPRTKHIATNISFFRDNIYEKIQILTVRSY